MPDVDVGSSGKIVMDVDGSRSLSSDWGGLKLGHSELETSDVVCGICKVGGWTCLEDFAR